MISVDNYSWNPLGIQQDLHFEITRKLLSDAANDFNLVQKRIDKNEFFSNYDGEKPSLVFCDANHSYEETKRDIQWALDIGAEIVCGHDYHEKNFPGVVRAVHEFGGPKQLIDTTWTL